MWQIDKDVANVGNGMMEILHSQFPSFPPFPTLVANLQTPNCLQMGEIICGKLKNMGANVGNSNFPHMWQIEKNNPH